MYTTDVHLLYTSVMYTSNIVYTNNPFAVVMNQDILKSCHKHRART